MTGLFAYFPMYRNLSGERLWSMKGKVKDGFSITHRVVFEETEMALEISNMANSRKNIAKSADNREQNVKT